MLFLACGTPCTGLGYSLAAQTCSALAVFLILLWALCPQLSSQLAGLPSPDQAHGVVLWRQSLFSCQVLVLPARRAELTHRHSLHHPCPPSSFSSGKINAILCTRHWNFQCRHGISQAAKKSLWCQILQILHLHHRVEKCQGSGLTMSCSGFWPHCWTVTCVQPVSVGLRSRWAGPRRPLPWAHRSSPRCPDLNRCTAVIFWMLILQKGDLWGFKSTQRVTTGDMVTFPSVAVLPDEKNQVSQNLAWKMLKDILHYQVRKWECKQHVLMYQDMNTACKSFIS